MKLTKSECQLLSNEKKCKDKAKAEILPRHFCPDCKTELLFTLLCPVCDEEMRWFTKEELSG